MTTLAIILFAYLVIMGPAVILGSRWLSIAGLEERIDSQAKELRELRGMLQVALMSAKPDAVEPMIVLPVMVAETPTYSELN